MKIAMISGHGCIRVQKMSIPLIELGHDVHLICSKHPTFYEQYNSISIAPTVRQYVNAIKLYAKEVDIFHCHNEPNWYVTAVREHTNKPVIMDVHDSHLGRVTEEESLTSTKEGDKPLRVAWEERNNFQLADGLIFVSKPLAGIVIREYKLKQPRLILPSFLPDFLYQYESKRKRWLGGLVYEGRIDLPKDVKEGTAGYGFRYCDYLQLAKDAKWKGMDFHLYSGRDLSSDDPFWDTYKDYAILHNARNVKNLLASLGRHDWGLVGNINKTPEWDIALPNKFFEYIAAGVPIVAINAKHCSDWIDKFGIGITVDSINELADRWAEHRIVRPNLIKMRRKLTMNAHIHKLEEFYRKFL